MSNYPDDIGNYSNDPRSPDYVEPICEECHQAAIDCECETDGEA
jgi:hypothetical protein